MGWGGHFLSLESRGKFLSASLQFELNKEKENIWLCFRCVFSLLRISTLAQSHKLRATAPRGSMHWAGVWIRWQERAPERITKIISSKPSSTWLWGVLAALAHTAPGSFTARSPWNKSITHTWHSAHHPSRGPHCSQKHLGSDSRLLHVMDCSDFTIHTGFCSCKNIIV